jgi:hypothetical protein
VNFVFVCPTTGQAFESEQFELIDNRGARIDAQGNRYLDATVRLFDPCPFCGQRHAFAAAELACPFSPE